MLTSNLYLFTFTRDNCLGRCLRLAAANPCLDPFIKPMFIEPKIERQTNALSANANATENLAPNVMATASVARISVGVNNRKYEKLVNT